MAQRAILIKINAVNYSTNEEPTHAILEVEVVYQDTNTRNEDRLFLSINVEPGSGIPIATQIKNSIVIQQPFGYTLSNAQVLIPEYS